MKPSGTFLNELERGTGSELVVRWAAMAFGLLIALWAGYSIANGGNLWVAVCMMLTFLLLTTFWLRRRAWVLILIGWPFLGATPLLHMPFSIRELFTALAGTVFLSYHILLRFRSRTKWHPLDGLILLNVGWLAVTFLVHPVGIRALGAKIIGGRAYFEIFIALFAYMVIVRLPDSVKMVSRIPYFVLAGTAVVGALNLTSYLAPSLAPLIYGLYSGMDTGAYFGEIRGQEMVRFQGMADFGSTLILVLCACYPPWTLLDPRRLRAYIAPVGWVAIFASGFRSVLGMTVMQLGLSAWLHGGWRKAVSAGAVAGLIFGVLIFGQGRFYQLPLTAQRTLAFLPGKWSSVAEEQASLQTESRFGWWKRIIEEHQIKNWWVGDGFGVSIEDYYQLAATSRGEWFDVTGAYHNGPLTAIRYVGVPGLVVLYIFMIGAAVHAVRCVRRCRGTILSPVAIFLAVQLVWNPFHYTLIFGGYDSQMPQLIFLTALLRLVIRMAEEQSAKPPVPSPDMSHKMPLRPATTPA